MPTENAGTAKQSTYRRGHKPRRGLYIKPYREYISTQALHRIKQHVDALNMRHPEQAAASIGSILAVLGHYASYNIRAQLFTTNAMRSAFNFNRQLSTVNPRPYFTRLLDSI